MLSKKKSFGLFRFEFIRNPILRKLDGVIFEVYSDQNNTEIIDSLLSNYNFDISARPAAVPPLVIKSINDLTILTLSGCLNMTISDPARR